MNFLKSAATAVIVLASVTFATAQEKKEIKADQSSVKWTGKKVTGQHYGEVDFEKGHLLMDGDKITGGEFVIDMTSIDVQDLSGENKGKLEGHLKSDDFFGVQTHPKAKMVITSASNKGDGVYGIVADLTIKNKTNQVTFDLVKNGNTATADVTIDRSKYDVRYGSGSFFDNLGDKTIYDNFDLEVELKF